MKAMCSIHGITEFRNESKRKPRWRCKACLAEAFNQRRRERKKWAVDYLGGECCVCGYSRCLEALEFHHTNPQDKEFQLSNHFRLPIERFEAELKKCVLLCANCHREAHY